MYIASYQLSNNLVVAFKRWMRRMKAFKYFIELLAGSKHEAI
jgi:hypothetical protein